MNLMEWLLKIASINGFQDLVDSFQLSAIGIRILVVRYRYLLSL